MRLLEPRYGHLRKLGSGGSGQVFLVRDQILEKEVALKLLGETVARSTSLERFRREFSLLAEIDHPGVARAYDFGFLRKHPYFTSEFIPGETLAKRGPIADPTELLDVTCSLAGAVCFLHQSGILHLDIKPSNIILSSTARRPVLVDFGLFRRGSPAPAGCAIEGSLPWMAPEHFQGGDLGSWTDVYALGVVFYWLATGRFPRSLKLRDALAGPAGWKVVPSPLLASLKGLPADLDRIILRALAIDASSRYRDAGELFAALEGVAGAAGARPEVSAKVSTNVSAIVSTVGREEELRAVERFLERVAAGELKEVPKSEAVWSPPVLFVTALPGMGQTHFFREIKVRGQTRGLAVYLETGYSGRPGAPGKALRSLGDHMERESSARWKAFLSRLERPRSTPRDETTDEERRLRWRKEIALAVNAVGSPVIIAVDGLQWLDEITVALLVDLARLLCEDCRGLLGIVLGYREEDRSAALLRELTGLLLKGLPTALLTLGPLSPTQALELYRQRGGVEGDPTRGLALFQKTAGVPSRIVALATGRDVVLSGAPPGGEVHPATARAKTRAGRRLLLTLLLLGRPATKAELSALAALPAPRLARLLDACRSAGIAIEEDDGWVLGPGLDRLEGHSPEERRRIHRRIAVHLSRRARGNDDPLLSEAARHFLEAGDRRRFIDSALRHATYLDRTFQTRAAVELYRTVLSFLDPRQSDARFEVALQIAQLEARRGEFEEGIELLREALATSRRVSRPWRARILLRMAALHGRRGDFKSADTLFREGLQLAETMDGPLDREAFLTSLSEHAALKACLGEDDGALELCQKAQELAARGRNRRFRDVMLNLHATRGNVALRRFHFQEAAKHFEKALETAEAVGSLSNRAVVLNNLGVVYSQSDRHEDAVRMFQEAARLCTRIDEGPSLIFIHGNLAVLHAKRGDFQAMEADLSEAASLQRGPGDREKGGRRQELFLEHHHGLALLFRGRCEEARAHFESAIRLGETVGDRMAVAFDQIYRAEALIFEGIYAESERALSPLLTRGPDRLQKMALVRLAFLKALLGNREEVEALASRLASEERAGSLDHRDAVFFGWALSIAGSPERGIEIVLPAERYFREHGLRPAAALAAWVRAEASFLAGQPQKAREILEAESSSQDSLTAALRPLLLARIGIEQGPAGRQHASCADLLAEAGAAMVGSRLPEWSLRLDVLRAALLPAGDREAEMRRVARERRELAPQAARRGYLRSPHWRAWTAFETPPLPEELDLRTRGRKSLPSAPSPSTKSLTRVRDVDGLLAARLVAKSPPMRKLLLFLERIRATSLPVVIHGETGAGKELVARIIHAESGRRGPFVVVDCATLPPPLLEVELFGARAGAFTDLEEDRDGILVRAAGGTVLIDGIAGASAELQAKLLRVVPEKRARPVGGEEERPIDVRFLFTTVQDPEIEVRKGRLREDLFHRIGVFTVRVPPLRERPEDFPELVEIFLRDGASQVPGLEPGLIERLLALPWPGNARELRNLLARLRLEHPRRIPLRVVLPTRREGVADRVFSRDLLARGTFVELKNSLEREYLLYHMERFGGDTVRACRFLGVTRKHLYRRLAQLGIRLRKGAPE